MNASSQSGPKFPRKQLPHTLTSYPGTSWKDAGLAREEKTESLPGEVKIKIDKLRAERLKLDKLLHWSADQIRIGEILSNLKCINDYIVMEGNSR